MFQQLLTPLRGIWAHPLGRRRPLYSLWRFAQWQWLSRWRESMVVPFVNDSRLRMSRGMTGLTGNRYCGLHEFESMAFLLHGLRSEDCFLDVGANAGSYSVLAAKGIGSSVIAVEPASAALKALRDNIACNDIAARISIHAVVAAEQMGTVTFSRDLDTVNHVVGADEAVSGVDQIKAETLDSICADHAVHMMKIDVEGYELNALRGASGLLASPSLRAIIVEINGSDARYGHDPRELVDLLHAAGFSCHDYEPFSRRLFPVDPMTRTSNGLFVRDPNSMQARLLAAKQFLIPGWGLI